MKQTNFPSVFRFHIISPVLLSIIVSSSTARLRYFISKKEVPNRKFGLYCLISSVESFSIGSVKSGKLITSFHYEFIVSDLRMSCISSSLFPSIYTPHPLVNTSSGSDDSSSYTQNRSGLSNKTSPPSGSFS